MFVHMVSVMYREPIAEATVVPSLHRLVSVKRAVYRLTVAFFGSFFPQKKERMVLVDAV